MSARTLLGLLALLPAAATAQTAPQSGDEEKDYRRFTAEHVFDLEYADDPQVSPDGKTIVYVRRSMDRRSDQVRGDLWIYDLETDAHRPLVTGGASAGSPRWSPDGSRLLYTTASGGKPELRVLYMDSGESFVLSQLEEAPRGPVWSPDGSTIAFTMFTPGETPSFAKSTVKAPEGAEWSEAVRVFDDITFRFDGQGYLSEGADHVYTVPAEGGSPRQITQGEADFGGAAWLGDETLLVVGNEAEDRDLDPIENEIYAVSLSDLERRALTDRDGPDAMPKVSPDGRRIAYVGYDDERLSYQQTELYVMDADGGEPKLLTDGLDRSVGDFAWSPDGRSLIVQVEDAGDITLRQVGLSGRMQTLGGGLGGTSIGRPYASASFSVGGSGGDRVIAYTATGPHRPADIAVLEDGESRFLTDLNADVLSYLDLAEIEEIKVPSSFDRREIEAWVALPPGFEADGSHPLILEIHGGPFAMYGPYFSAEMQRYAAEGYVTVYVNPRGSTGYGEEFAQLIDLNYPGEDYDDLMSVVTYLVERDYADPERLFVTGGSGGGILTAWIVGMTDRFQAAASVKPVINWMTMALAADIAPYVKRHWIRAEPWTDPDAFLDRSPIMLIENVTTPTLVMVGEEDWRTPTWEAEQFYTALQLAGVETALIRVPGSSHSIASRPSRLIAKTDNIMGWFAAHDAAKANKEEDAAQGD
ncbi:alpha/beta hydrolase family protein [Parvularcula oceani]|uniref:alpha/beta hydrolase family protein n=1 Tax=Parvularcula oceani TaxID=1247963 RepID=UPI0004E27564|nr:S9 family peptidase [Parvularcula oceani]